MGLEEILKGMGKEEKHKLSEKPAAKLTAAEIARFKELESRAEAFSEELNRIHAKLRSDGARNWADLQDKYDLHGKNLRYNEKEGALYEILDDE